MRWQKLSERAATSNFLGALRLAQVVRFETEGRYARYRLKHPREIRRILQGAFRFCKNHSDQREKAQRVERTPIVG